MAKNTCLAYLLWLLGGWFGLHQFYLGRDRHAFVWYATAGGVFGIGWLRDATRIPSYVADANETKESERELRDRMSWGKPKFSFIRFLGQLVLGWLFGVLSLSAIPEEILQTYKLLSLFMPYAVALGVYTVGNIGQEKVYMRTTVVGAYLILPLSLVWPENIQNLISYSALISAAISNWQGKDWKPHPRRRSHVCKRLVVLVLCCSVYSSLWISAFYHNASITTNDGEKVKVRDAIDNFFKSPAWAQSKETMKQLYKYYQVHGFHKMWEEFVKAVDPEGEENAYKVLGVQSSASEKEITVAYKTLVKKWHPDKIKDPTLKEEAHTKFMEIQKAYETLSAIKTRRSKMNEKQQPS